MSWPIKFRTLPVLIVSGLIVVLFHSSVLQFAYGFLVLHQPTDHARFAMVATPSVECFDAAADLIATEQVEQVLLVGFQPRRAERSRAYPDSLELWRKDLANRGVAKDKIRLIRTQAVTSHQMFRELDRQLEIERSDRSSDRCVVISISTLSRYYRCVIDQAQETEATNYQIHPTFPKSDDASSWWRSRSGLTRILNHGLRLAFVIGCGESEIDARDPYQRLIVEVSPA